MKVIEVLSLKQPRTAIDIIIAFNLDDLAEWLGLQPVKKDNKIIRLMNHRTYARIGRRVKQREGKVIA